MKARWCYANTRGEIFNTVAEQDQLQLTKSVKICQHWQEATRLFTLLSTQYIVRHTVAKQFYLLSCHDDAIYTTSQCECTQSIHIHIIIVQRYILLQLATNCLFYLPNHLSEYYTIIHAFAHTCICIKLICINFVICDLLD